ncbi:MAG: SDR family oxidoreductase [Phycisphaerae bacterium]|nr:SDR family oxidoreductase [Phycisphaerae bacterium]
MPPPVAIVTGAGSGIGRATARRLAEAGWSLVLAGRTRSKLQQALEGLASGCGEDGALVVACDLKQADACADLVAQGRDRFGGIDALVNVAGYAALASVAETTDELWRETIDTNLSAVVYLTRAVWPVFADGNGGVIVNVSSMAALDPLPGFAAYAAAKGGLNLFTEVTNREGEAIGVRAVAICPGAVETPMLRGLFDQATFPPDQTLDPDTVAELIVRCLDPAQPPRDQAVVRIER